MASILNSPFWYFKQRDNRYHLEFSYKNNVFVTQISFDEPQSFKGEICSKFELSLLDELIAMRHELTSHSTHEEFTSFVVNTIAAYKFSNPKILNTSLEFLQDSDCEAGKVVTIEHDEDNIMLFITSTFDSSFQAVVLNENNKNYQQFDNLYISF